MTCIVGVVGKNFMVVGADSAAYENQEIFIRRDPKVIKIKQIRGPDALIAFAGFFRHLQLLYGLKLPEDKSNQKDPFAGLNFVVTKVIPMIRKALRAGGCVKISDAVESVESQFLLAYRNSLYSIGDDFGVEITNSCYASIGSGSAYALGALDYIKNHSPHLFDEPEKIIKEVLNISEVHCTDVQGPMNIFRVDYPALSGQKTKQSKK